MRIGHIHLMGAHKPTGTLHHLNLTGLGHTRQAAGELAHHLFFPTAQLVEIDLRFTEGHPVICKRLRLVHHTRNM